MGIESSRSMRVMMLVRTGVDIPTLNLIAVAFLFGITDFDKNVHSSR